MWILIFSIMKKLWDLAHEKLIHMMGRHGILDEMAIYVVKQLKNDSYR